MFITCQNCVLGSNAYFINKYTLSLHIHALTLVKPKFLFIFIFLDMFICSETFREVYDFLLYHLKKFIIAGLQCALVLMTFNYFK